MAIASLTKVTTHKEKNKKFLHDANQNLLCVTHARTHDKRSYVTRLYTGTNIVESNIKNESNESNESNEHYIIHTLATFAPEK